jgi:hypothetical protein
MSIAYEEIIDFIAAGTTPESLVNFQPSEKTKARVWALVERSKSDGLSEDEATELDNFMQLEHLMRMAKAKALGHLAPQN